MAKGVLYFNLPEEETEFQQATDGFKLYAFLWDLDMFLRNKVKHGDNEKLSGIEMAERVRQMISNEIDFTRMQ